MFGLALGVTRMNEVLPSPVYALLSGLNASTVGIIALAAVQLAEKAVQDRLTRVLVIGGACAGLCYGALWYFPVLIAVGGVAAVVWDGGLRGKIVRLRRRVGRGREGRSGDLELDEGGSVAVGGVEGEVGGGVQRRNAAGRGGREEGASRGGGGAGVPVDSPDVIPSHSIRIRVGIAIAVLFFGRPIELQIGGHGC